MCVGVGGVQTRLLFSSSLLYGTPAPSAESQQSEAWPVGRIENQKIWIFSIPQVGLMDDHKNKHIYILNYFFHSKTALENDKTCFLNPPLNDFYLFFNCHKI